MKTVEFTGENTVKLIEGSIQAQANGKRASVYKDVQESLGVVPGFLKLLPETHLVGEWRLFKEFQLSEGTHLSPKVKELIGLAVASALHCQYCTLFHTVAAGVDGATADELNEALLMAKQTAGWSTYLNGTRYDIEQLRREVTAIKEHVKAQPTRAGISPS